MQQGRLDVLSLLSIKTDVLRKIKFDDLIKYKQSGSVTKINIIFHLVLVLFHFEKWKQI